MISLSGRKALITGGSRGIGRATALLMAKAGADVAINYVHRPDAAEVVRKAVEALGRECLTVKADLSREEEARRMVVTAAEKWRRIDILVNNAGIWTFGEMGDFDSAVWEETIRVNLNSVFYMSNAVIPLMKAQKWGRIINVSSTAGVRGEAFHSHYAASKAALHGLAKSWAPELAAYNILVNCVAPGWVDTDMCAEVFRNAEFRKRVEDSIPLKRIPPPEDIAGPILFLASDLARHITGTIIHVNGGAVLCG